MEAGAKGFFSKSTPLPELTAAIRAVVAGENLTPLSTTLREFFDQYMKPALDPGAASLSSPRTEPADPARGGSQSHRRTSGTPVHIP